MPVEDRLVDVGDVLDAVLSAVEQDRARKLTSFAQDAFAIEERLARVVGHYVPEARRTKNAMLSGLRSPPRPTKRPPRDGLGDWCRSPFVGWFERSLSSVLVFERLRGWRCGAGGSVLGA